MRLSMRSKTSRRLLSLLPAASVSLLLFAVLQANQTAPGALAQTDETVTPVATAEHGGHDLPPIPERDAPRYPKMDSMLNQVAQQVESGMSTARVAASRAPASRDDTVGATFYTEPGYAESVRDFLRSNGAATGEAHSDYVSAYVPVTPLGRASELDGVTTVHSIMPPQLLQGAIVSEGVSVHRIAPWHQSGFRGRGVKIGIIDGGFKGFQELMGTELPSAVSVRCYNGIGEFTTSFEDCGSGISHGTAVTEAVFDIAPEATYYVTTVRGYDDLREAVEWMVSEDVDIINHSLGWPWLGPGDGTSPFRNSPLKSVDVAVDGGIVWVGAAGNEALATWFGEFNDPDRDGLHNYSGSNECNRVQISPESYIWIQLRWDDSWKGAATDLDFYITRQDNFKILGGSESRQSVSLTPYESVFFRGPAEDDPDFWRFPDFAMYCVVVKLISGDVPDWIQLNLISPHILEHRTFSTSIASPMDSRSPGLLAVGATDWADNHVIWEDSSRGPTTDGRIKPDVVGVHDGNSRTWGPWLGTSQASPHVAGLAVLAKQRYPTATPSEIANFLRQNSVPRGAVPNNTWGYGLAALPEPDINADEVPTPTPSPTPEPTPEPSVTSTPTETPSPEATQTATPEPTVSPTETPTPEPIPEPEENCSEYLADGAEQSEGQYEVESSWHEGCESLRPAEQSGPRYSRYYMLSLDAEADVTISLTSQQDGYLYLLGGFGKDGDVLHENDDRSEFPRHTDSLIEVSGMPNGQYTIDATTYSPAATGAFTLVVAVVDSSVEVTPVPTAIPTVTPEPTPTPTPDPTPDPGPPDVDIPDSVEVKVSAGPYHACVVSDNLFVVCQGLDSHGQVSLHPVSPAFVDVAAGERHSCALSYDGLVRCWGSNEYRQADAPSVFGYIRLMAGLNYTCAYHQEGRLDCWGLFTPTD